ncbi:4'-phosphopantetheinyl transferase family protein [Streptomyces sp. NPDC058701]|uniref:4'-phosphopantetheinyl transferase family protein n=1 Tax=Streptomyces sp. NPDC058701 TaxID=3346608 RepID=UPI003668C426
MNPERSGPPGAPAAPTPAPAAPTPAPAAPAPGAPLHVPGPDGPWDEVGDRLDDTGRAVVCTTWGQWLTAVLLDPALRALLGEDWPRYRQTPAAAGRIRFAVSRAVAKYAAAAALNVPAHTLDPGRGPGARHVLRGPDAEVQVALAHAGELVVAGVSRTGPIGVHVRHTDRDTAFGPLLERVCTAHEGAALAALPEEERRARLLALWGLKEACARALEPGTAIPLTGFGFTRDDRGRLTPAPLPGTAGFTAGRWSVAGHLVQGRYLVSEAHHHPASPAPAPAGAPSVPDAPRTPPAPAVSAAPAVPAGRAGLPAAVDAGSRGAAGPLEEPGPGPGALLRFPRPVTSGRGEGGRTP